MPIAFVLWFVFTVSQGHLMHMPMDEPYYATKEECDDAADALYVELKKQWPDDENVRTYCEKITNLIQGA